MIENSIKNINIKERGTLKGMEIAKIGPVPRTRIGQFEIEIVQINGIKDGVELFARAWDLGGNPIALGNGVETEHFIFMNPPILTEDIDGKIIREYDTGRGIETKKFTEDPKRAILRALEHTILVSYKRGMIPKSGSVGHTTLTAYPDAGTGGTTVDGYVSRIVAAGDTWANIKVGAGTNASASDQTGVVPSTYGKGTGLWKGCQRVIATFNTATLGSGATISAAVLSFYAYNKYSENGNTPSTDVYLATPAANNNLAASDYGQIGTTSQSGGAAIAYASVTTSAYNDWTFDATGRGNINKTGVSAFGLRMANYDVGSDTPTNPVSEGNDGIAVRFADYTGTDNDPKLVVTYSSTSIKTYDGLAIGSVKTMHGLAIASVKNYNGLV